MPIEAITSSFLGLYNFIGHSQGINEHQLNNRYELGNPLEKKWSLIFLMLICSNIIIRIWKVWSPHRCNYLLCGVVWRVILKFVWTIVLTCERRVDELSRKFCHHHSMWFNVVWMQYNVYNYWCLYMANKFNGLIGHIFFSWEEMRYFEAMNLISVIADNKAVGCKVLSWNIIISKWWIVCEPIVSCALCLS